MMFRWVMQSILFDDEAEFKSYIDDLEKAGEVFEVVSHSAIGGKIYVRIWKQCNSDKKKRGGCKA